MTDAEETWAARVSAIAALDEPSRRQLYEYVVRQQDPVSRDEAAEAVGAPRTTVAFHLDKLVGEGLLEVVYERRSGRGGPGAGRPAKLYRRSSGQIMLSLPERRYELAAGLLADALVEAGDSALAPEALLQARARELGRQLGAAAQGGEALRALEDLGFEPRRTGDAVVLVNCPFGGLARRHAGLVCRMNLGLLDGLLEGLRGSGLSACLDPGPGHCCVRLDQA